MNGKPDYRRAVAAALSVLQDNAITHPPVDPIEIARSMGAQVKFVSFNPELKTVSGFYDGETDTIFVNADEFPLRQTFTIAHELGHRILHREWANSSEYKVLMRDSENTDYDPYELEANVFAANLLAPRDMLDNYWPKLDPQNLSKLFAISVPAVSKRIKYEYGA